jgi:GTPase
MPFHSGFISIIGLPNAGKSTLLNALIGQKLAIVTPKAQTTRHSILGIINTDFYQMILTDTPGIINPKYKLHERMMHSVDDTLKHTDGAVLLFDATNNFENQVEIKNKINGELPFVVALNKTDAISEEQLNEWKIILAKNFPDKKVVCISAEKKINLKELIEATTQLLPEHPPFYDNETLTDRDIRFFISEIIREKIFLLFKQEIPYSTEVVIEEYKDEQKLDRIRAIVFVERESQKAILLGKGGSAIKKLGTESRIEIEKFIEKKIFLELTIKIRENWRNNITLLKKLGY